MVEQDALSMRVFECLFTASFLAWMGYCFCAWEEWLTAAGFDLTESDLVRMGYPTPWPLLTPWQVLCFAGLMLLGAVLVIWPLQRSGVRRILGASWSRRLGFVLLFATALYAQRVDFMMTFAGNKLFVCVFAVLMVAPAMTRSPETGKLVQSLAPLRLLQASLLLNYFASGLAKMEGDWLQSGDVLWSVVQGIHRTDFGAWALSAWPKWVWTFQQHISLAFEVGAPLWFLIRSLRPFAIGFGLIFHLMIALLMHDLIFFSLLMWSFYALFVTPEQWRWLGGRVNKGTRWITS